jgi:triacylglycerol lipase
MITTSDLPQLRAAYSDRTAALMAAVAALAYDYPPEGSSPGAAPVPPGLAELGFHNVVYFHNGLVDGWAFLAESADLIAVAFRGTASVENWKTDLHAAMVHPDVTDPNLRVHAGFFAAFKDLCEGTSGLRACLSQATAQADDRRPIYVTGHSLGGALAQIATAVLGTDQFAACYTFGSPRVGNSYFDLWVKPPSYRVMDYADIVPQVPLPVPLVYPYRHSGDARYLPNHPLGTPYRYEPGLPMRLWQLAIGLIQFLGSWQILGIKDHSIGIYAAKLASIADARTQSR